MPGVTTEEQGFVYFYINYLKNSFVKTLRIIFGHDATSYKYRYDKDINKSQFDIRSDFPQRITKVPMAVVEVGTGDASVTYLGDEIIRETTVEEDGIEGYLYGGKLTLNVSIKIFGGSMRDTEHLTDLVALYTRYLFRQKFAENNIAYVKVNVGAIQQDGDYFMSSVDTEVTSEFTHLIPKTLYDTVQGLNFELGTYF